MASISQLHIDVTLTADEAARVLKSLRNQGNDTFGGLGEGAEGAKGKIIALNQALELGHKALGALGMIINAVGGVGRAMIEGNAQFEKYETSLTVMLGSADAAKGRLKELSDFAAKTPFELPEVVEAGNQLQALGRYSQETLTNLGDLASAAGKPMEQATAAFAKLASGQKGVAVDMFRDLLISVDDWVAATGKGVKANGELEASAEEMAAALPKILEAKGFTGMMEAQAQTFDGLVSTMKDSVAGLLRELGGPLFGAVKNIIDKLVGVLSSAEMQELIGKIGAAIAKVVEGVLPLAEALIPVMGALMEVVAQLLPPLADLVAVLVESFKPILAVIIDLVVQLAPVIGTLVGVVARVARAFAPVLKVLAEFLGDLLKPLIPLIVLLADVLVSLVPIIELIYPAMAAVIHVGTQMITAVVTPLIDAIRWIIENAKAAIDAVTAIFGGDDDTSAKSKAKQVAGATAQATTAAAPAEPTDAPAKPAAAAGGKKRTLKDIVGEMIEMNKLLIDDGQQSNDAFRRQLEERLASVTGNSREELDVRRTLRAEIKAIADKALDEEKKRVEEQKKLEKELSDAIRSAFKLRDEIREMDMGEEELALRKQEDDYSERLRQLEEFHDEHLFTDAEYQQLRETLEYQHQEKLFAIEMEYLGKKKDADAERVKSREESMRRERDLTVTQASEMLSNLSELAGENFQAQKGISVAQAIISTYAGATKALEQGGILGIPLMATVILSGLAQVAKIMSTNPVKRRTGGLVPGGPQYVMMNEEGEEYVMNAAATRRNLPVLEAINAGASIADATGYEPVRPAARRGTARQHVSLSGAFIFEDGALRAAIEHELALDMQGAL